MSPKIKELELTQVKLKEHLHYSPDTGIFTWINPMANCLQPGDVAGSVESDGYVSIRFNTTRYKAHRLAWFYIYGTWPKDSIDHINRNKSDNRISNLRAVSMGINNRNRPTGKENENGCRGVEFIRSSMSWRARIQAEGKRITIGTFHSKEQAIEARRKAEIKYGYIGE